MMVATEQSKGRDDAATSMTQQSTDIDENDDGDFNDTTINQ
jgi:hypothetical protein